MFIRFVLFTCCAFLLRATLQDDVNIISYKLDLNFYNFTELQEFEANATIKFKFKSKTVPEYIYLYASEQTLDIEKVTFNSYDLMEKHFGFENETLLKVFVPRELEISNSFKIVVRYKGIIGNEECGVFMRSYPEGRYFVSSNFGGECARRVLPIFHEYGVKSTYEISAVIPIEYLAISNTERRTMSTNKEKGLRSISFKTTPGIAPSSLQIIVGEFECDAGKFYYPVTICTCIELNDAEAFAADTLIQLMSQLENITDVDYKNFSSKMDLVVFPILGVESTSALGIIAAGPEKLLWETDVSCDRDKQSVATFLAKKVAEQWFIHFVSPKSNNRNFLNEGFTEYIAYKALNEIFPEEYYEEQFMVEVYQSSLEADSEQGIPLGLGHQLFGISAPKLSRGSCLIKMTENILGSEVFNNVTKQFISEYRLGSVEPEEFWSLIDENMITNPEEELPANFSKIMENWTKSTRYPVLEVKEDDGSLTVTQKHFGDTGTSTDSWYIPIALTTEHKEYLETMWLTPEAPTVKHIGNVLSGVILNKNTGYYRVDYDTASWANLRQILLEPNFGGITETDRSLLTDDIFNMAKYGRLKYVQVGDILKYLQNDTSYFSWYTALKGFRYLLDRTGENTELGQMISKKIINFLEKSYYSLINTTLPTEHNHIDSLSMEQILYWFCRLGNKDCIQNLQEMFDRYKTNYITINADVKKIVFCSVLRYSNDFTDVEFIWKEFNNSSEVLNKFTFLPIVGCLRNERMLEMCLDYVLKETDRFTFYDFMVVFTSVYEENPEGIQAALKFFSENIMAIYERLGNLGLLQKTFTGLANKLTTVEEYRTLKSISLDVADFEKTIKAASDVVENNIAWLKTYRSDLESHFIYGNGAEVESPLWATLLFLCYMLISYCVYNTSLILYLRSPVTYQEQVIMLEG